MTRTRTLLLLPAFALTVTIATPAMADGNVHCTTAPKSAWKPLAEVKKKAWMEGWTIQKVQVEGTCYEVYARTEAGQAVEAFFDPVTLKKLIVYRRGKAIFTAPGFKPN